MTNPTAAPARQALTPERGIGALQSRTFESAAAQETMPDTKGDSSRVSDSAPGTVTTGNERPSGGLSLKSSAFAADTHDYRDFGLHELKRDPGREWERNQQREYAPGLGRR